MESFWRAEGSTQLEQLMPSPLSHTCYALSESKCQKVKPWAAMAKSKLICLTC